MKKIILGAALTVFAMGTFAQKKEMNAAISNYQKHLLLSQTNGKKDEMRKLLDDAKTSTDNAIQDEKTKVLSDLWINRALIVGAKMSLDSPTIANVDVNLATIKESLDKAKELDVKGKNKSEIEDAHKNLLIYFNNGGATAYNNKDFASAYKLFNEVAVYNPQDTTGALVNAGVSARAANNIEGMMETFQKAIDKNDKNAPNLYSELINANLSMKKDTTTAMKLLNEAATKFPENLDLVKLQAQILLNQGNTTDAMKIIDNLIIKEPKNPVYYVIKGQTFLNSAYDIQKKKNALPDSDKASYQKLEAAMKKMIDDALPLYEKALSFDTNNISTLEGLKIIYNFKNDEAKYNEIKAKLDASNK